MIIEFKYNKYAKKSSAICGSNKNYKFWNDLYESH